MKTLSLSVLLLGCMSQMALADMTGPQCDFSWNAMQVEMRNNMRMHMGGGPVTTSGTMCNVTNVRIESNRLHATIGRFSWQIEGLEGYMTSGTLLRHAVLEIDDLYVYPATDLAWMDYALRAQAHAGPGISVQVEVSHDAGRIHLSRLEVDFPGENRIEAGIVMHGFELHAETLTDLIVEDAFLNIQSNGLFETYALMPYVEWLLADAMDPEAEMAQMRQIGTAVAMAQPEDIFPLQSREAMAAVVNDLLNPTGWLRIRLDAPEGLPMSQFYEDYNHFMGAMGLVPVALAGTQIHVSYDPIAAE